MTVCGVLRETLASGAISVNHTVKTLMDITSIFCTFTFLILLGAMTFYIHKLYRELERQVKIDRRKSTA